MMMTEGVLSRAVDYYLAIYLLLLGCMLLK